MVCAMLEALNGAAVQIRGGLIGKPVSLEWRFKRLGDCILFSARDVTSKMEFEQQIKGNLSDLRSYAEGMEQLAYAASHDIQEPLRTITNFAAFLKDDYGHTLPAEALDWLDNITAAAKTGRERVRSLLNYSRIGQSRSFGWHDSDEVLRDAVKAAASDVQERGATVMVHHLPRVWCDAPLLGTVFGNLLSNALKFCDKPDPTVFVSATENDEEWIFSVKDNGPGIDPKYHTRIFNIFSRLDKTKAGVGIGLASCKRAVQIHSGRIWVESEATGTTFFFTVARPLHESNPVGRGSCPRCVGDQESSPEHHPSAQPRCCRGRRSGSAVLAWRGRLQCEGTAESDSP